MTGWRQVPALASLARGHVPFADMSSVAKSTGPGRVSHVEPQAPASCRNNPFCADGLCRRSFRPANPRRHKATPAPEDAARQVVVITGSRLQSSSTFETPTPVTSLAADDLQVAAPATLADALRQIASVVPGADRLPAAGTANGGAEFPQPSGSRERPHAGASRWPPVVSAGPTGTIDTNLIPQGLVERVDVVTGGASAAYGSDAVGGVVNFVLDTKFEGLKANIFKGLSERGDGDEFKASLTYGASFADGAGHILFSGEYYTNEGVAERRTRISPHRRKRPDQPRWGAKPGHGQRYSHPVYGRRTDRRGGRWKPRRTTTSFVGFNSDRVA